MKPHLRIGAPVFNFTTPTEWAEQHTRKGLSAAYWPLPVDAGDAERNAFLQAAADHDILIAEVGVWNNPLHPDPVQRETNIRACIEKLRLADAVGARCCVNISGSRGDIWDAPHPANLTPETFDLIVATTRRILHEAAPAKTFYTLETMPWMYPCDLDSMQRLLDAVAHPAFAVHIDMCNLMNSPEKVYRNAEITRDWFNAFGPHIRCIHAKDLRLHPRLTVHIDEAIPGQGQFDFPQLLRCAAALGTDIPVMCEHLQTEAEYDQAAAYLKATLGRG